MKRLVVLVSGGGSNLQALIDACTDEIINGEIVAVFSNNKEAYGLKRAKSANINEHILEVDNYEAILDYEPDGIILAGYLKIIPESFVNAMQNKIINIHPSLIPNFSGPGYYGDKVHKAVLKRGVKVSGATTHFVSEIADAGPIIKQKVVSVHNDDTVETLSKRVLDVEHKLIVETVKLFCENKLVVENEKVVILEGEI